MACEDVSSQSVLCRIKDLLRRKPKFYDVDFCVGPAKKNVKGVQLLLEAASPALEKRFEDWEDAHVRGGEGDGIPIPFFDPEAFETFVNLTMFDEWNSQAFQDLKLEPSQILSLIPICSEYEMKNALQQLEERMKSFYSDFAALKNTPEFLDLSYENMRTILASDYLSLGEVDVFDWACRWAKAECLRRKIEENAENLRLVLGEIVFEIRFPAMTTEEFTQCIDQHDILTPAEGYEVFRFLSSKNTQKINSDKSRLPFKHEPRVRKFSTLSFTKDSPIVNDPPFVCNGEEKCNWIAPKEKMLVHGLGFLGPVDEDASYDVTVQFRRWDGASNLSYMEMIEKRVFAEKGKVFHVMFDQPLLLEECSKVKWTNWKNFYKITYYLKGPNTQSFQRTLCKAYTKRDGDKEFPLWWSSNQLATILYSYL